MLSLVGGISDSMSSSMVSSTLSPRFLNGCSPSMEAMSMLERFEAKERELIEANENIDRVQQRTLATAEELVSQLNSNLSKPSRTQLKAASSTSSQNDQRCVIDRSCPPVHSKLSNRLSHDYRAGNFDTSASPSHMHTTSSLSIGQDNLQKSKTTNRGIQGFRSDTRSTGASASSTISRASSTRLIRKKDICGEDAVAEAVAEVCRQSVMVDSPRLTESQQNEECCLTDEGGGDEGGGVSESDNDRIDKRDDDDLSEEGEDYETDSTDGEELSLLYDRHVQDDGETEMEVSNRHQQKGARMSSDSARKANEREDENSTYSCERNVKNGDNRDSTNSKSLRKEEGRDMVGGRSSRRKESVEYNITTEGRMCEYDPLPSLHVSQQKGGDQSQPVLAHKKKTVTNMSGGGISRKSTIMSDSEGAKDNHSETGSVSAMQRGGSSNARKKKGSRMCEEEAEKRMERSLLGVKTGSPICAQNVPKRRESWAKSDESHVRDGGKGRQLGGALQHGEEEEEGETPIDQDCLIKPVMDGAVSVDGLQGTVRLQKARIIALQEELQKTIEEFQEKEVCLTASNKECIAAREDETKMRKQLQSQQLQSDKIKKQFDMIQAKYDCSQKEVAELRRENERLCQAVTKSDQEIQTRQKKLNRLVDESDRCKQQLLELKSNEKDRFVTSILSLIVLCEDTGLCTVCYCVYTYI
eukprot:GHVQ01037007.1.p1 GENE.GHVQ01037007.1~~GHVQ01037007.1.p1  ORF type:complete len:698 (+),score=184.25 GHVQ01037007.1:325-2418(+)